jgi:hypothetical protein
MQGRMQTCRRLITLDVVNLLKFESEQGSTVVFQAIDFPLGSLGIDAPHSVYIVTPRIKGFLIEATLLDANLHVITNVDFAMARREFSLFQHGLMSVLNNRIIVFVVCYMVGFVVNARVNFIVVVIHDISNVLPPITTQRVYTFKKRFLQGSDEALHETTASAALNDLHILFFTLRSEFA